MSKKVIKVAFIIILLFIICLGYQSFAMSVTDLKPQYTQESKDAVNGIGKELLGVIKNIAVISSVVILAFIGLRFMFGSIEQRAEYKKTLLPLAIGCFVVMSATGITNLVWKINGNPSPEHECNPSLICNGGICGICGTVFEYKDHDYLIWEQNPGLKRCRICGQVTSR